MADDSQWFLPMDDKEVQNLECEQNPPWSEPTRTDQPLVQIAPEVKSVFNVVFFLIALVGFLIILAMVAQWFIFHVG